MQKQRKFIYIMTIVLTFVFVFADEIYTDYKRNEYNENEDILLEDEKLKETTIKRDLVIKNIQTNDEDISYTYLVELKEISGAYKYTYQEKDNYLVFPANGQKEITIQANQIIIIHDIPENTNYKVTQITNSETHKINESERTVEGKITDENIIEFRNELKEEKPVLNPTPNPQPNDKPVEEPLNPPKKEDTPSKNPITADNFMIILMVFTLSIITTIVATKVKIKRFED